MASFLFLARFRSALYSSFDEQLRARASLVAEKTNIQPRIVPLPQGNESFVIIYHVSQSADTMFKPAKPLFRYPTLADSVASGENWRAVRIQHELESGGRIEIIYALPADSINTQVSNLSLFIWLVLPLGTLLSMGVAYWLSTRLLKPVRQVINLANSINLDNHIGLLNEPIANDETKELIVSFNRMLLRIKEQSERQAAFFASASHELRTPLSVMQTRLDVLQRDEQATTAARELYAGQLKEVRQLNKMVNDFLLLGELRNGKTVLAMTTVNMPDFLLEQLTRFKEQATAKGLSFKIAYGRVEDNYDVQADTGKLQIIVGNLLENAVKYTAGGTAISCTIERLPSRIGLTLVNHIRADITPQVADLKNQFYHSKPIHGEGFGLGLWIANQLSMMQDMELYCTVTSSHMFEARLLMKMDTR